MAHLPGRFPRSMLGSSVCVPGCMCPNGRFPRSLLGASVCVPGCLWLRHCLDKHRRFCSQPFLLLDIASECTTSAASNTSLSSCSLGPSMTRRRFLHPSCDIGSIVAYAAAHSSSELSRSSPCQQYVTHYVCPPMTPREPTQHQPRCHHILHVIYMLPTLLV